MQITIKSNAESDACNLEKAAWHKPSVARIDIKRTLSGAASGTDGPSGASV